MRKIYLASSIILILIYLSFANTLFALANTIEPSSKEDMENQIYSAFESNLQARKESFSITVKGSYLKSITIIQQYNNEDGYMEIIDFDPKQPYFKVYAPFTKFKYKNGNDYLATIFDPNPNSQPIFLEILSGNIDMQGHTNELTLNYTVNWEETVTQSRELNDYVSFLNTAKFLNNSKSNYERIKTIHDFLLYNYSYDNTNNSKPTFNLISSNKYTCENMSAFFYLLLKKAGFEARIVLKGTTTETSQAYNHDGIKEAHAWNMVLLDGKWYHIDITWDDTFNQNYKYNWFLKSSATFNSDHFWDENENYYHKAYSDYIHSTPPQLSSIIIKPTTTKKPTSSVFSIIQSNLSSILSSEALSSCSSVFSSTSQSETSSSKTVLTKSNSKNSLLFIKILIPSLIIIFTALILIFFIKRAKDKEKENNNVSWK